MIRFLSYIYILEKTCVPLVIKMSDKKIIRAEELPEQEKIFLRRDFLGWRVVYPWKNEDGTLNWRNILTNGKGWKYVLFFLSAFILPNLLSLL